MHLFDIEPGVLHRTRYMYGATIEQLNGDMFFRAENPPFGATIWYHLRNAAGADVRITITDREGGTVRTLTGPGTAGLHPVQWDLTPDNPSELPRGITPAEREALRWVAPGRYTVRIEAGGRSLTTPVDVVPEGNGVRRGLVRKSVDLAAPLSLQCAGTPTGDAALVSGARSATMATARVRRDRPLGLV